MNTFSSTASTEHPGCDTAQHEIERVIEPGGTVYVDLSFNRLYVYRVQIANTILGDGKQRKSLLPDRNRL